jgi:hypothetical protein
MDTNLSVGRKDETFRPGFHVLAPEYVQNASCQSESSWGPQPQLEQTVMRARSKIAHVRKIQVLCNEKSPGRLRGLPNLRVGTTTQPFRAHIVQIMVQLGQRGHERLWKIFIQFDFHAGRGAALIGKSSCADAAAKAIKARTAPSVRVEKSAKISLTVAPSAKLARMVRTVTRVPFITHSPPQTSTLRSKNRI